MIWKIPAVRITKRTWQSWKLPGAEYLYQKGDTRTAADRESFVKAVVERFGEIDVLVNNAGVAPKIRLDMLETTEESFDFVVGTVLKGTMFMTQLVANQMLKQPWDPEKSRNGEPSSTLARHLPPYLLRTV